MKSKILALCLVLALCGCASEDFMADGVPRFVGKDIKTAIAYLGYPDQQLNVQGHQVYVWRDEANGISTIQTYKPQSVTTDTPYGTFTSYSNQTVDEPFSFHRLCKIDLMTNSKGIIIDADYVNHGCLPYETPMEQLIKDTTPKKQTKDENKKQAAHNGKSD